MKGRGRRIQILGGAVAITCALLGLTSCSPLKRPDTAADRGLRQLLPARVRRLSNIELERAVGAVLGTEVAVAERLPPDVRQSGYSPNAEQPMAASTAVRWSRLVDGLTAEATTAPHRWVECATSACSRAFIVETVRRAWRRPASVDEIATLQALFQRGASEGGPGSGAQVVLSALLQAPSFLYVTELGEADGSSGITRLTDLEIASALSFTLSGGPPGEELLDAAERGDLVAAESRRVAARRILGRSSTRHHFRRFVLEWLEVDQLENTAKDPDAHPNYERLKTHMLRETQAYVDEVMVNHGASVAALLLGGFAAVDPSMARYYGLNAFGPVVPLAGTGRVGILQQASFLSAHAHPDGTSPVRRGDFVLRKLLCKEMPRPAELGIETIMPVSRPGQSTRERFVKHTADPQCQSCHQTIDPLGFAFENFDAAGRVRDVDGDRPVETRGRLSLYGEKLTLADSAELARWLAGNARTRECFARQAFRYFSAQSDPEVELGFLDVARGLVPSRRDSLIEVLVEYVASDLFVYRSVPTSTGQTRGAAYGGTL
jgi:hypothetical protein